MHFGFEVAVAAPYMENLQKRKAEIIEANRSNWFRPLRRQILLGTISGKPQYQIAPVLGPDGKPVIRAELLRVTCRELGADR